MRYSEGPKRDAESMENEELLISRILKLYVIWTYILIVVYTFNISNEFLIKNYNKLRRNKRYSVDEWLNSHTISKNHSIYSISTFFYNSREVYYFDRINCITFSDVTNQDF